MRIPNVPYIQGRNSYDDKDDRKYGIAIHNTSNDATARQEANYAQNRTDGVSAHLYVDNIEVIQSIDLLARTGHAGSTNGNEHAVSVEITGVNGWSRNTWLNSVNWTALGSALAWVCGQFGIAVRRATVGEMQANPKVKAFYSHDDMRRAWGGTDHTDPGPNFPWDRLFEAVLNAGSPPPTTAGDKIDLLNEEEDAMLITHVYAKAKDGKPTRFGIGLFSGGQLRWLETDDQQTANARAAALGKDAKEVSQAAFDKERANFLPAVPA